AGCVPLRKSHERGQLPRSAALSRRPPHKQHRPLHTPLPRRFGGCAPDGDWLLGHVQHGGGVHQERRFYRDRLEHRRVASDYRTTNERGRAQVRRQVNRGRPAPRRNGGLCRNLALLTGHIGREGTGLNPLRGQNNVQGASDAGAMPWHFPGYQEVDKPEIVAKFAAKWGSAPEPKRGLTTTEIVSAAGDGRVKAM